ncbi:MAG: copper resistance protein CopC [Acidimicrobiia bacterium]
MGTAAPASAHAILLRTEPSPQTTVPTSPGAVRLFFSEPVQGTFGAVRVFDVEGRRVDAGTTPRPGASRRELVLPVAGLRAGTYTVTWRVVSDDGHPIRGGFAFYVEAPSTISAVALPDERSAGRAVDIAAGVARFVWFMAFAVMIGSVVVRRFVWTPAADPALRPEPAAVFRRRFRSTVRAAWVVLACATGLTLAWQAAKLSGLPLGEALRPAVLGDVLDTTFGRLWTVSASLTAALVVPVIAVTRAGRPFVGRVEAWLVGGAVVAATLAVTVSLSGHARTDSHPVLAAMSIAVHLSAMAVWVGGLVALIILGGPALRAVPGDDRKVVLARALRRFSPIAIGAVLLLVATGTLNSVLGFGSPSDLWRVAYGRAVLAKIVVLVVALAVASRHLLVLPRRLATPTGEGAVRSFRRSSVVEASVLLVAVALAAGLVDLVPGRAVALAAKGPVNAQRRAGPYVVQLFVDPTTRGDNEIHVTFVDDSGLAAAGVTNVTVTAMDPGRTTRPVVMRLLAPGHFVGELTLPEPGRYQLAVDAAHPPTPLTATFVFNLSASRLARRN